MESHKFSGVVGFIRPVKVELLSKNVERLGKYGIYSESWENELRIYVS